MADESLITLDKIDILRERAGVSYKKAYEVLQATGGDVVQALIKLEEEPRGFTERITVSGSELVARVRELIREGNVNRIVVKRRERVLMDIPVTVGAVGAVLMPYLAALGVIAALATRCTLEVERRQPPETVPLGGRRRRSTYGSAETAGEAPAAPAETPAASAPDGSAGEPAAEIPVTPVPEPLGGEAITGRERRRRRGL